MLSYKRGSILHSLCQTIVNPVNTVGVMGAGLALTMANAYPNMVPFYKKACNEGLYEKGRFFVHPIGNGRQILCFPTKGHWQESSDIERISLWLDRLVLDYSNYNISSLAVPLLGCGLGGLKSKDVLALLEDKLGGLSIEIHVYV